MISSSQASAQPQTSAYLAFSSPSSAPGSVPRSEERKSSWGRLLNPPGLNLSRSLLELLDFPKSRWISNSRRRSVRAPSATGDSFFSRWINTNSVLVTRNSQIVTLTGLGERAEGEFKVQPQGKAPKNRSPARRARGWHGVRGANPAPGTSRAAQRPETGRCFSFPRAPRGTSRAPRRALQNPPKNPRCSALPRAGVGASRGS